MTLINLANNPSSMYPVKELALAGLLNKEEGSLILNMYRLLINYTLEDKIAILAKLKALCEQLPISELEDPTYTCEYIDHGHGVLQSTRLPSLFSHDHGQNWYDLNKQSNNYKFWNILYKIMPKYFKYTKQAIAHRKLYFVEFPYVHTSN